MRKARNGNERFYFLAVCVCAAMLALTGCHTRHDIHITLDIRLIEAEVGGQGAGTRSLAGGADALLPPSDIELTPTLKTAIAGRRTRLVEVRQLRASKKIGENNQGLLAVPSGTEALYGEERLRVARIVEDENRDRETIFSEISKVRKTPVSVVRQQWAEQFRTGLGPNEWFETPQDPDFDVQFRESPLGKTFPSAPPAGSWTRVPVSYMPPGSGI